MHVSIRWFGDQFNVFLHIRQELDEFLTIKGCRIVDGSKGPFVSWPATKSQNNGKWWSHVWASEKFAAHVLGLAQESRPAQSGHGNAGYGRTPGSDDEPDDGEIPF